jgi:hypothetical protein
MKLIINACSKNSSLLAFIAGVGNTAKTLFSNKQDTINALVAY